MMMKFHPNRAQEPRTRSLLRAAPHQAGMTLVEIMIVLTIMAGIMAFAAYNVVGYMKNAKIREAQSEVGQIRGFIDLFRVNHNRLPDELAELEQEVDGFAKITNKVPNDPWDNPYDYSTSNDNTFILFSLGPDGQSGSDDDVYPDGMEDN